MKILAIDSSGMPASVAVCEDGTLLAEYTLNFKRTHSQTLVPMLDEVRNMLELDLESIDAIAVAKGPGSFIGLRIGSATAKGLAHGAGLPCIAVDALEALSESAGEFDGIVCPIQDARAGQVYGAAFRNGERLIPDAPMKLEEYLDTVSGLGSRFLFTGDGAPVFRERIAEILGERAAFAPAYRGYLRPSAAGSIAIRRGETTDYLHLEASYLRPPNAQKNKKLLEAMRKNEEA